MTNSRIESNALGFLQYRSNANRTTLKKKQLSHKNIQKYILYILKQQRGSNLKHTKFLTLGSICRPYTTARVCLNIRYAYDTRMIRIRYAYDTRMIRIRYAYDTRTVYNRYAYGMRIVYNRYAYDTRIVYNRYAYDTRVVLTGTCMKRVSFITDTRVICS
jgi:hypothetical protein